MIIVTIWCRACSRNLRGEEEGKYAGGWKLERSDGSRRCWKKWVEEGNPSEASQECWSDKLLSEPGGISCRQYLLQERGGAGHRAKPVLNALLNFTNLRRAVNHLGGSAGLGCCSCRIWPGEVPAEFFLRDGICRRIHRVPTTHRPADYVPTPNPDIQI